MPRSIESVIIESVPWLGVNVLEVLIVRLARERSRPGQQGNPADSPPTTYFMDSISDFAETRHAPLKRCLAIGDILGCYTALKSLVAFADVGVDETLVTLDDYVDRGPDTIKVLDWLIARHSNKSLVSLRGNHEVMMLNARINPSDRLRWGRFGGIETLDSYATSDDVAADLVDIPDSHWRFLADGLLPYHETETHIFVHATVDPRVVLRDQTDSMLYWGRYSDNFPGHISGKTVVCGHKSQESGLPATNGHAICIDTGACKGRWLSCLDTTAGTIWQANQAGQTRQLHISELFSAPDQ